MVHRALHIATCPVFMYCIHCVAYVYTDVFWSGNQANQKNSGLGPWISKIDWCEGHWCGSTCMVERLSDVSSKTGKKGMCFCVFRSCFWAYVGQPHNTTPMLLGLWNLDSDSFWLMNLDFRGRPLWLIKSRGGTTFGWGTTLDLKTGELKKWQNYIQGF